MGINNKKISEDKNDEILEELEKDTIDLESSDSDDIGYMFKKWIDMANKAASDVNTIVEMVFSKVEKSLERKLTFDEFFQIISMSLDSKILATQKEEKIRFISGKFIMTVNRLKKIVEYKADCYYQDAFKEWVKQEHKGHIKFSSFDKSATVQLKEILDKGKMEIEIEPPESDEIEL